MKVKIFRMKYYTLYRIDLVKQTLNRWDQETMNITVRSLHLSLTIFELANFVKLLLWKLDHQLFFSDSQSSGRNIRRSKYVYTFFQTYIKQEEPRFEKEVESL